MNPKLTAQIITRIILPVIVLLISSSILFSQPDTWSQKADLGGIERQEAVGFSIGNKGYIGTGYGGNGLKTRDFWEYDPATDVWAQKADFGGSARTGAVGFSIGQKGYIGTGFDVARTKDFWEYDPATNTWAQKANFGGSIRYKATGFSIGSKGYIGTGNGGTIEKDPFTPKRDFWEYNPATDTWVQKSDFGGSARESSVGFSIDNKGYIGTGDVNGGFVKDFWEYDPITNTWLQKSDFGGTARASSVGFSINNKGYIGTGIDASIFIRDFWEYDPSGNIWVQRAEFPGTRRGWAVGFSINSKGYLGTGHVGNPGKDFWEYTPCESNSTFYRDADGDEYGNADITILACIAPAGYVSNSTDCNDNNNAIHPGATEICNGIDDDCDGLIDEVVQTIFYRDLDEDGYGNDTLTILACIAPAGYVNNNTDCNDSNNNIHPGAPEICNGIDDDCDGSIDEGVQTTFYRDADSDGYGNAAITIQACSVPSGYVSNGTDCNDANNSIHPGATEFCNGIDDDCNGIVDDVIPGANPDTWQQKADFGGLARLNAVAFSIGNKGYVGTGAKLIGSGSATKDFWEYDPVNDTWSQKADFGGAAREQAAGFSIGNKGYIGTGQADALLFKDFWEYDPTNNIWVRRADFGGVERVGAFGLSIGDKGYIGTGYDGNFLKRDFWEYDTVANSWTQKTDFGGLGRLNAISFSIGTKGYAGTGGAGGPQKDFWEYNPVTNSWTQKADFGGEARAYATGLSIGSKGYIGCGNGTVRKKDFWEYDPVTNSWTQKADFGGTARFGAVGFSISNKGFIGSGYDANNNTKKDFREYTAATASIFYRDADNDGYGDANYTVGACNAPAGYVNNNTDCNDNNNSIHPGATETCNGIDDDCDGLIDEGVQTIFYQDADGDGYGYAAVTILSCAGPNGYEPGHVNNSSDCNDANNGIHPGAPEICNGIDDNCNGLVDETDSTTWIQKADLGGIERWAAVGFSIANKGYMGTGKSNTNKKDFWEYDPSTNIWSQKADFGGSERIDAVGFSIGSKGYIGTGFNEGVLKNDFWEYDPTINTWIQKADFPAGPRSAAVGFSISNKGYIGTGNIIFTNTPNKKDFWEYDPATDTWTQKADFGGTPRNLAVGFSIGNKGYIGTGYDGIDSITNDFWEYDPATDTWIRKADFAGTARQGAIGFSIGSKGYIGTGVGVNSSTTLKKDFWEYDPLSNVWTQKVDFGGTARYRAVGFSIGAKGYVGTGDVHENFSKDFWEYTVNPGNNFYRDADNDSYGDPNNMIQASCAPSGYVSNNTDCNDANNAVHPGATEICNGIDDDCDGLIDEGVQTTFYRDSDGDGYGNASVTILACTAPVGYVNNNTDCNDANSAVHPGAIEICNGTDDNCNDLADESVPGSWVQKANFGGTARYLAVGFSIGNKGYIGTGYDGGFKKDFWEYDPSTNTWSQKADVGNTTRGGAVGFSIGNKGYIGTGGNQSINTKDFWEYDPSINTWVQKADFGGSIRSLAIGFSIGSKGYVGTGVDENGNKTKDFWEYDPLANTWIQKADFGGAARSRAVGFFIGNKGYIGTGEATSFLNDFWEYDPSANIWLQKANFGGIERCFAVGFSIGTKGYIGTGLDETIFTGVNKKDFWEYDPSANTWVQKAGFGGTARHWAVGFSIANKGYIGTGIDVTPKNDFWEYTLEEANTTFYRDSDNDTYGDPNNTTIACNVPPGYVSENTDCNDANNEIHPGATEICGNNIDDDCDGLIDEGCVTGDWYRSKQTGNWNNIATWEVSANGGLNWANATAAPTSADGYITIRNTHTVTITTAVTVDDVTVDTGGILTQRSNITVNNGVGNDIVVNGTYNLENSRNLQGSGSTLVNNVFNLNAGDIFIPVTLASTATLNMNTGGAKSLRSLLTNNGTINWSDGNFTLQGGTLINNAAFNMSNSVIIRLLDGAGANQFTNTATGTITKSGTNNVHILVPLTNDGNVQLNSGTFRIQGVFTNNNAVNFSAGSVLESFNPGVINFETGTVLSGTGTIYNNQVTNVNTTINLPVTISFDCFGDLGGSGSFTVNGAFNWDNGNITCTGTIAQTGILTVTAGAKSLGSTFTNNGIVNWTNGNISFAGGTLINNAGFNISNDDNLVNTSGVNLFINSSTGILTKISGAATSIQIPLTNDGLIQGSGTLTFGAITNNGIIAPGLSPGILTVNSTTNLFTTNSELQIELNSGSGAGTGHDQLRRNSNLILDGTLSVAEGGTVPDGSYEIIRLTAGTISGSFNTVQLPPGYSLRIQNNNRLWLDKVSTLRIINDNTPITRKSERTTSISVLFPNPADNEVNLRLTDELVKGNISIQLVDRTGRMIKQWIEQFINKSQTIVLNTASIRSGLYILIIKDNKGGMISEKVMILH